MIDFEKLVGNFLIEADSNIEKTTVTAFLKAPLADDQTPYQVLKKAFETHYNSQLFPFLTEEEFYDMAYNAANSVVRATKDSDKYPKIVNSYPLLDLFALLSNELKKGSQGNKETAKSILDSFVERLLDSNNPKIPLEYHPTNTWAKSVREDYVSETKQEIGKARLDTINPNYGIYATILQLLAIRRNAAKLKIPVDKLPPANEFVKKIFFDPQVYVKGQKTLPSDDRLKLLYNDTSANLLLRIAMSAYALFKQQLNVTIGEENVRDEGKAYAEFLGDGTTTPKRPMNWNGHSKEEKTTTTEPTPVTRIVSSFDNSLELLHKEIVNETELKTAAEIATGRFSSPEKVSTEPKPESEEKDQKLPTIMPPFKNKQGSYEYTLGNINKFKTEVPAAKNLYNQLLNLANYIQQEAMKPDWYERSVGAMSGATQIAKGLSLGVPTMGR